VLTAAALVPPTPLLVPGVSGRTPVLQAERDAALAAVGRLVASAPEVVVVVTATGPMLDGPVRPSLGAAGVPDADLAWPGPSLGAVVTHVPSAVGLHLLQRAGWGGATQLRPAAGGARTDRAPDDPGGDDGWSGAALARRGAALVADRPTALLVVAGGSVRRGDAAPLPADPRAAGADEALLAWLRGGCAGPVPIDRAMAAELGIDLWAPAQVLAGALAQAREGARGLVADVALADPFGAAYLTGSWIAAS
jgi:hypothetical protein